VKAIAAGVLCLAIGLLAGKPAPAAAMKLEDAIRAALQNSPLLRPAEESVRQANGALLSAKGAFDWNTAEEVGWDRLYVLKNNSNGSLTNSFTTEDVFHETVGLSREFRNGISIQPGVTLFQNNNVLATNGITHPLPTLGIKIPLLRGLGEASADAAEIAAQAALKGSQLQRIFVGQQAVHDAVEAYWRCAAAYDHVAILTAAEEDAAENLRLQRQLASKGSGDPLGLASSEADLVMRQINLSRAEDAIAACQRDLALLTGSSDVHSMPVPVEPLPLDIGRPPSAALDDDALVGLANANRADVQALNSHIDAASARLRGAQDEALPSLGIYVDPRSGGLRYSQSLQGNLAEGDTQQALAAQNQARIALDNLRAQIRVDIATAANNIREALANYGTLTASARSLETTVTELRRRTEFSAAARPELLNALDQLTRVRNEIVDLDLEYATNLAVLRLETGTIAITNPPVPSSIAVQFLTAPRT
jgi:outer membrane protein TolC